MTTIHQRISNCLWFDKQAEEAARFYTNVFPDSVLKTINHYGKAGSDQHGQKEGSVMTATFTVCGYEITALNAGPLFKINPSVSFFVTCDTKDEIDSIWNSLVENGTALMALDKYDWSERYGWVQDKFGLSWQLTLGDTKSVQRVTPSFLFANEQFGRAEEAIHFYSSIFDNSNIEMMQKNKGNGKYGNDTVLYSRFTLAGQQFNAMDSAMNHPFNFNEAISFIVYCDSQKEIDYYWNKLTEGGEEGPCGWLKDKFGVWWQVEPVQLIEMMLSKNVEKRDRVMNAFMKMKKFDLARLEAAFNNESAINQ